MGDDPFTRHCSPMGRFFLDLSPIAFRGVGLSFFYPPKRGWQLLRIVLIAPYSHLLDRTKYKYPSHSP